MQRMHMQISGNTATAGTDAGGIATARKGAPRKRVFAPRLLGTRMVVGNQQGWHEEAVFWRPAVFRRRSFPQNLPSVA